ncbi:WD40 repeat-like protein [Sistotremastrum niveocremeum HHB9708]|uniref:Elongator complex protein 2 n=1 Tax=Sistotremastrum niveocremeum HHB9708 TaxID=1314777 RepID=A0A164ZR07_9AGAM|nr:WD40 repeat-like protein [Sistotremastrum niveocremeum HHB9708]
MASASTEYISASTNRFNHAAAIGPASSLIAFGSHNFVALWDASDAVNKGIYATLPGHEAQVTVVHFLNERLLASADENGVVLLRRKTQDGKWKISSKTQAHTKSISALTSSGDLLVTGASDSLVKVWSIAEHNDSLVEVQSIDLKGRYALDIKVTNLPNTSSLIMAIGSTERNIQLWVRGEDQFQKVASLFGHEDWIRTLAFSPSGPQANPSLTLASGSQDGNIRLWLIEEIQNAPPVKAGELTDDVLDAFEASLGDVGDADEGGRQLSLKRYVVGVKTATEGQRRYSVTLDALLVGHEAGVTSLEWRPAQTGSSLPSILSTSTDSSLIIWSPVSRTTGASSADSDSLWIVRQRFGDVGGQRLGGFVGGLWARKGAEALAWGWNGCWRRWRYQEANDRWAEATAIGGHQGPVRGASWSPGGEYLISTGLDQTTRAHGKLVSGERANTWAEIARPQIHGYDVIDVAHLDSLKFVSVSDEKVARVFEAPKGFASLVKAHGILSDIEENTRPLAASLPPLGLSNKAVTGADADPKPLESDHSSASLPLEGELQATTLWPETEKVFGHGYELIALATSHSGTLLATACKSTSPEHAVIRVHETKTWQLFGTPLAGHALTVTRIAFSPDDRYILTVSRDRTWRVFALEPDAGYRPVSFDKSHARIIWDCAWSPTGSFFATAARDKTVRVWKAESWKNLAVLKLDEAATAVDVAVFPDSRNAMAIGLENGVVLIYSCREDTLAKWTLELTLDSTLACNSHIFRVLWRPTIDATNPHNRILAICSEDRTLRVVNINLAVG